VWVPIKGANEVAVIETTNWTVASRIKHEALLQPHQIVFSADGRTAFVSNNNKADHMANPPAGHEAHAAGATPGGGSLVVIDAGTRKVSKAIPLGKNLTGIGTRARQ
jgi:DNA-binding beta-propeller fold protein YncE